MTLLLHTCCGPCLSGVFPALQDDGLDITAFFFNPNIHPKEELERRIGAFVEYTASKKIKAVIKEEFERSIADPPGERCAECYRVRLRETARYAKANRFKKISTTLLISPYQDHEKIKEIGEAMAEEYGIIFYYRDFRPFYKDSVLHSKSMGLYRQKYCGCEKSKKS